jgi:hypothetical protein
MEENRERSYIAEALIGASLVVLIAISASVIAFQRADTLTIFNSVLPLLGTWIGTVLAYYFTRSNFEAAANVYKQSSGVPAASETPVTTAMIDKGKIGGLIILSPSQTEAGINIQTGLLGLFKPPITRIPIFDSNSAIKYIIHESTLNKFITKNLINAAATGFNFGTATLQTLLNDPELRALATAYAIVPSVATLADAKKRMDETTNCEDIFVTETGKATESVLGWITDVTLGAHARI